VDLTGVEYGYTSRHGRDALIIECKEDIKKRGLVSPDLADALALTLRLFPVVASDHTRQISTRSQLGGCSSPLAGCGKTILAERCRKIDSSREAATQQRFAKEIT
jgi:hypothetical protein